MIIVFGGTTEGRKAAEVLEAAGKPFYYSTFSNEQEVELVHGIRLTGGMEVLDMIACCREHDIRLIVDAAHPFAEELHRNLLYLAKHISAPIIRYDRIYPPHDERIVWCKDYADAITQMETWGVKRLLALTGVNTIGALKPFWEKHECWCRILNRRYSHLLARKSQFPEDHLVYYEDDETSNLISRLHPDAMITKESGMSGGFCEKVAIAQQAGVKVFAVERPEYPPHTPIPQNVRIEYVNGPHGLRRTVEHLLPDFYPLKSGLTTGTCATAAAVAALRRLQTGESPSEVLVRLPNGETLPVAVGSSDGFSFCIKDAGDDPDVTNGIEVRATVQPASHFEIRGGEGVGRFTLLGFDYPPGEPAINRGPRQMLRYNTPGDYLITISMKGGAEIARRTFNPRLGIEGGISIIGVSGIVQPYSEEAFLESIRKCMEVAKASGSERVVIGSGAKSENALRSRYPDLPPQAFVQYGNFVGETLHMAADLGIPTVTLGVMLGKAVKLAAGQMDTHSRRGTFDRDFLQQLLTEAGCDIDISSITLVRELWELLSAEQARSFATTVLTHCAEYCAPLLPAGQLTILLVDDEGGIWE